MKKQFVVIFYQAAIKKTHTPGNVLIPYYAPFTGAAVAHGTRYPQAGQPAQYNTNPPLVCGVTYNTQAEAEKAAQELVDEGFYNVGVFSKLGEFAPAAPTWQEVA